MIPIPTHCPTCNSKLSLVNDQLFCTNSKCPAQSIKKLEHFCKVMKIKGMGPASLDKLAFESITDIYTFSKGHYTDALGSTIGEKLYNEVRDSENQPLHTVLAALSIPLIGETAAKKIASVVDSIKEINTETCSKAKLGDKASNNLLNWLNSEECVSLLKLPLKMPVSSTNTNTITVCITGKLKDYKTKADAKKILEAAGYTVVDNVTKLTNILIDEEGKASSKRQKADSLGIRVTTIKDILKEDI